MASATCDATGAGVLTGGSRGTGFATDLFYEPTVLDGVQPGMAIVDEETFGPVVPILKVASETEALELLKSSPYGLTAAVFTRDLARGLAFAERAEVGWVNINASTNLWESHLAFGGPGGLGQWHRAGSVGRAPKRPSRRRKPSPLTWGSRDHSRLHRRRGRLGGVLPRKLVVAVAITVVAATTSGQGASYATDNR
jgi:hypothetical protein